MNIYLKIISQLRKEMKKLSKQISKIINFCTDCPYATIDKVYTADSFENVQKVFCSSLNKVVHSYLETFDKANIPVECKLLNT
jgi:hypothetical protein